MNTQLKTAASLLREVRSELHNTVDVRVIKQLDEAIEVLEAEVTSTTNADKRLHTALHKVGGALKYIPAIKAIFEELMK